MSPAEKKAVEEFTSFINRSGAELIEVEEVEIEDYYITIIAVVEYSHGEFGESWSKHQEEPENEWECGDSEWSGKPDWMEV